LTRPEASDEQRDARLPPSDREVLDARVEASLADASDPRATTDAARDAEPARDGGDRGMLSPNGGGSSCACGLAAGASRHGSLGAWLGLIGLAAWVVIRKRALSPRCDEG
jgi:hypothetical protein